jgi:uncharacterized delta-60 repeat protein
MRRQHTMNRARGRIRPGAGAVVVACLIGLPGIGSANAADGSQYLDSTFGGTGLVLTDFTTGEDGANAVDIGPDGNIIAAGFGDLNDPSRPHVPGFAVAEYLPNGDPDTSFSSDGKALVDFGFVNQEAAAVEVDSLKRVVSAGTVTTFDGSTSSIGVSRLRSDGTPDPGFGPGGLVTIQPGTLSFAYDVALDADDGIVILGVATGTRGFRPTLIRFNPDGSLVQSFGSGGVLQFGKVGKDSFKSIAIDRRGRLLLAGSSQIPGTRRAVPAVLRTSVSGDPDPNYGKHGVALPLASMDGELVSIALDGSGRPLVTATCDCGPKHGDDFAVGRLTLRGRPDESFSSDGRAFVRFGRTDARPTSIAIDPAGRAVVAGSDRVGESNEWALARLKSNGKLDHAFGDHGTIVAPLGAGVEGVRGIAVDSSSRVVTAGLGLGPLGSDFAVARFR